MTPSRNAPVAPAPSQPISLPRLPPVTARRLLENPGELVARGTQLVLGQSWRPEPEPDHRPGHVWLSAAHDRLLVMAELPDLCIRTSATADHQHLWELGDVFEILIQPLPGSGYFEFQIAPNECLLQLRYPRSGLPLNLGIEQYVWREPCVDHAVARDAADSLWRVAAVIPVRPLLDWSEGSTGSLWRAAFCRYDYADAERFVLSSTAPLGAPSFHRLDEWHTLDVPGGFPAGTAAR
ncbi:hypothetical protein GALL_138810 [mine drainage metagenome]|uniref:Carbohydrate-binding domain-containing protein n=1 Tax=mine drainage metagenome TaxID=410659 RepID=A0A1J5SIT0_9ZZZZ